MLFKEPAGRYASAADVLADLHDVRAGRRPEKAAALRRAHRPRAAMLWPAVPPTLRPAPEPPSEARRSHGKLRALALAAALAAAVLGIAALAW
jgi:hypothetical protein